MLRTLIIIAVVALIFLIIKNRLARKNSDSSPERPNHDDMAKCLQCETYIPKKEAIISGTNTFCSEQHMRDWEKSHSNDN